MALSPEEIRWVAHLARLQLSDAELNDMSGQLAAILEYVQQLQRVDTEGIEPLAHPLPVSNVFRADEPVGSLSIDRALANAPKRDQDFFSVPPVLESS